MLSISISVFRIQLSRTGKSSESPRAGLELRITRAGAVVPLLWSSETTFDFHLPRKSHHVRGRGLHSLNPKWARFARE